MKQRILTSLSFALLLSLALLLVLVACGGEPGGSVSPIQPPDSDVQASEPGNASPAAQPEGMSAGQSAASPNPEVSAAAPAGDTESRTPAQSGEAPSESPAAQPSEPAQTTDRAMRDAYRAALEGIYTNRVYPNGDPVDTLDPPEMDYNSFAVFDVDGDGVEELVYRNENSYTAGMVTTVYAFDPVSGTLYEELSGYVGMTFYNNGVVTVMASHNQGLGQMEDFWPYAIYQHDPGSDGYLMAAAVDGWDGSFFPEDHEGNPFPSDIDQDGDKAVYILTSPGQEVTTTMVDGPAYQEWLASYLSGAAKLDIPYQKLTPENIRGV